LLPTPRGQSGGAPATQGEPPALTPQLALPVFEKHLPVPKPPAGGTWYGHQSRPRGQGEARELGAGTRGATASQGTEESQEREAEREEVGDSGPSVSSPGTAPL
jgi:hypothetical protein